MLTISISTVVFWGYEVWGVTLLNRGVDVAYCEKLRVSYVLPDQPLRMWQGQWDPIVYCFSYWKELKTLLLTMAMELIKLKGGADGCGTTVFYLTDKSTTYWIAQAGHSSSPCLHRLIWQIQCLELEFGIHLQVVHVPCVVTISQGSDALSHGVWVTPFQSIQDQCTIYCFCLCTCRTGSSSHRVLYQAMVSPPPILLSFHWTANGLVWIS